MGFTRRDNRRAAELRPLEIIRGFTAHAQGSVLIRAGHTHVLCTACWSAGVPEWKNGTGTGWVTAEYDMLPGSTSPRRSRSRMRLDGRTQEIQRLIGRSLRAVVDLNAMGENTIYIDCDVLQADGGTRTAAITGAYVALHDAVAHAQHNGVISGHPLREAVAALSVGRVDGRVLVDLDYTEDVRADVDMNVVMTASGRFVEVQGTGEGATFTRDELDEMVGAARRGIRKLFKAQADALGNRR